MDSPGPRFQAISFLVSTLPGEIPAEACLLHPLSMGERRRGKDMMGGGKRLHFHSGTLISSRSSIFLTAKPHPLAPLYPTTAPSPMYNNLGNYGSRTWVLEGTRCSFLSIHVSSAQWDAIHFLFRCISSKMAITLRATGTRSSFKGMTVPRAFLDL